MSEKIMWVVTYVKRFPVYAKTKSDAKLECIKEKLIEKEDIVKVKEF